MDYSGASEHGHRSLVGLIGEIYVTQLSGFNNLSPKPALKGGVCRTETTALEQGYTGYQCGLVK